MSLPLFHLQLTNMYPNYHDIKRESANFQPDIVCLKQINGIFTPKGYNGDGVYGFFTVPSDTPLDIEIQP